MFTLSPDHLPFDIECDTQEELKLAIEAVLEISPVEGPDEFSGEPVELGEMPSALTYARNLVQSIYDKHFKATESPQVQWQPLDDLMGILTQIDNLVSGLHKSNHYAPHDWDLLLELMTKHEWKPEDGPIVDVLSKWLDQFVMESATRQGYELKLQEMDGANNLAGQTIQNLQNQLQKCRANADGNQVQTIRQLEDMAKSREYWRDKYKNLRAKVKSAL